MIARADPVMPAGGGTGTGSPPGVTTATPAAFAAVTSVARSRTRIFRLETPGLDNAGRCWCRSTFRYSKACG